MKANMKYSNILSSSVDEVVKSYKIYLEVKRPDHLQELKKREKSNPDGVRFEAAMFSIAREEYNLNPVIGEIIGEGGVDFICSFNNYSFVLEVTHTDTNSIKQQSGLGNDVINGKAQWFSMITHILKRKAVKKAKQVANHPMPRIVCIGASHISSTMLLGKIAAKWLLTSETKISLPVGVPNAKSQLVTDLKNSAFMKICENGKIGPRLCSISGLLLVAMGNDSYSIVGILHPEPAHVFDISLLPNVPFVRISNWPCPEGQIKTEWIVYDPPIKKGHFNKIELKTEELKSL